MRSAMLLALVALASLSSACGDETESKDTPPTSEPESKLFEREPETTGPRLWLDASRDADGVVHIEVHAADLGEVFGWAAHVRWDAPALTVEAGDATQTLGADTDAARLVSLQEGDAALGEARRGSALGGVAIDEPTILATLDVGANGAPSAVSLERAIVRRADGSYVEITTAGGHLIPGGGAQ